MSAIFEIDADHATEDEKDLIEYIDELLFRVSKLNRKNDYCSTREDNKTVIEMSDGKHSLFFGRYDWKYWIGLDVLSEHDACKINLSDVSAKDWYNLKNQK